MKATVLIANHNYGHYINDALDSVFAQTYRPLQICIIDDGSQDNSWDLICKRLFVENVKEQMVQETLIKQSIIEGNKFVGIKLPKATGPSNARNVGIELTKEDTDIYVVLDADDEMLPNKVARCVEKFKQYPQVGVVYGDYDILNVETNNTIREYKWPYSKIKLLHECIVHSNAGIRKQALLDTVEQTGYYDNRMRTCEDYDLWIRISEKYMISHIPEVLTKVRVHNNNATNSVNKEVWQQNWALINHKLKQRTR